MLVSEAIHSLKLYLNILLAVLIEVEFKAPDPHAGVQASYFTCDGQQTQLTLTQFLKQRTWKA